MSKFLRICVFILLSLTQSASYSTDEIVVQTIELAFPLTESDIEISGLTWCGDSLVLLPQYPERFSDEGKSHFYAISKKTLLSHLQGDGDQPDIVAQRILVHENDVRNQMSLFEGFEAIACEDDVIWLSIEAQNFFGTHQGYIVPAELELSTSPPNISIRTDQIRYVKSQSGMHNKGEEAILLHGDHILSFHELYDERVVPFPKANQVHRLSGEQTKIDMVHLPYRLTDATDVDDEGRFWVINYQYSGDRFARGATDVLADQYGKGKSHQRFFNTERLIEYQFKDNKIERTDQAPIQLRMLSKEGRNWEGIARLNNLGFLIATDKYPTTILGFVPFNH